jgi:hypothetical protein
MAKKDKNKAKSNIKFCKGESKAVQEARHIEETDVLIKITKDNSIQASMPAHKATQFQARLYFILSSFLSRLGNNEIMSSPYEIEKEAVLEGSLKAKLVSALEDTGLELPEGLDIEELTSEELAKLKAKKYQ